MRLALEPLESRLTPAHHGPFVVRVWADPSDTSPAQRAALAEAVFWWDGIDPRGLRLALTRDPSRAAVVVEGGWLGGTLGLCEGNLPHATVILATDAPLGYDVQTTAAHELGHALGLPGVEGHDQYVMNCSLSPGIRPLALGPPEVVDLVFALYPCSGAGRHRA